MVAQLWAYSQHDLLKVGEWKPGNNWTSCVHIESLTDLLTYLKENVRLFLQGKAEFIDGTHNQLEKVGILVHGTPGQLLFKNAKIRHDTFKSYAAEFKALGSYLRSPYGGEKARLAFFSCNVADGVKGDAFLGKISKVLPQRRIIGFEVQGITFGLLQARAGDVYPYDPYKGKSGGAYVGEPIMTEKHKHAKWVEEERVVKAPSNELWRLQNPKGTVANPRRLCGSRDCSGHQDRPSPCPNYKRAIDFLATYDRIEKRRAGDMEAVYKLVYGRVRSAGRSVSTRTCRRLPTARGRKGGVPVRCRGLARGRRP